MSATELVQWITDGLYVLIFLITLVNAIRRPRRATIDTVLFFCVATLIIAESLWTNLASEHILTALIEALLMALPYCLLRLVDDFAGVPKLLSRLAIAGLAIMVVAFFAIPTNQLPRWLLLFAVVYFVGLALYVAFSFAQAARHSSGVTRRRMQAVATSCALLGLAITIDGLVAIFPDYHVLVNILGQLFGLGTAIGFFIGFAPPGPLRRAWQEPDVRAFFGRTVILARLADTREIVREMERGAATVLGTSNAIIGLWDEERQLIVVEQDEKTTESPSGLLIGGQALAQQRPLFVADAARADPDHADSYRASGANAILAAPISIGDKRLGVLMIYSPHASIFAEDDLQLVALLADQAAVILESRALLDEATRMRAQEETTHLKEEFLAAAAHDLKTPLTGIVGRAQLLQRQAQRDPTAPVDARGLEMLVADARRMHTLVVDLLDVARIEQGKLVGTLESANISEIINDACERHSSERHRYVCDLDTSIVGTVDVTRIAQLIDNLLDNAVKYSPDGGDIRVQLDQDGDRAALTVTDSGIGIPIADLPYLFERFRRGENADGHFGGMGLGLFICRSIVEQHGGRIWATSDGIGTGSAFHVELPLTAQTPATDTPQTVGV